jgi:glycosyltransferase involved in cell wall biosynthesis
VPIAMSDAPILVTAITDPISSVLLTGQLRYMKREGFVPILVSAPGMEAEALARSEGAAYVPVPMERPIRLLKDLKALFKLYFIFKALRPTIVNAGTPKAGLLCTLAATLCGVPVRVYTVRGFRFESASGWLRMLLKAVEWAVARMSHRVVCISPSVRSLGMAEGLFSGSKAIVLAKGSSNGVDLERFTRDTIDAVAIGALRKSLGLEPGHLVLGFVGRLIPRKGLTELLQSWESLERRYPAARLLLVGNFEEDQPVPDRIKATIATNPRIIAPGFVSDVEKYFALMDVFVLPAHWEGFGNVLIQAAAMELPIVTTDVTGARDAVSKDCSALVVAPHDSVALEEAIARYFDNPALRCAHGKEGRRWVTQYFSNEAIWRALADEYRHLLATKDRAIPI